MAVRISLTGALTVSVDDRVLDEGRLRGGQTRLLLAVLVRERHRALPRARLAEILWPNELPPSWDPALRGVLSKVRALWVAAGLPASDVLTFAFGCYQLHLPVDTTVDTELAGAAVEAAEEALLRGDTDRACDEATIARGILSRLFLPGEDGPWVEGVRADLRSQLLRALEALSEAHARKGRTGVAVEAAEAAIAHEPLRESAYRHLMAAHSAAGNRGAALQAYERCRRVLAEELGVDPSAETEEAYLELLGAAPVADAVAPVDRELDREQLPPFPDALRRAIPFVGRKAELTELDAAWTAARAGRRQVVLLAGEAGMGKTSLAAQLALQAHREKGLVLYGRSDRDLLIPYEALAEAFSRYVAQCPVEQLRRQLGVAGPDLALLVPQVTQRLPGLSRPEPADPEADRHRLFAAASAFVDAMAQERPVVLVVEDLQWAGTSLLLLLRYLCRSLESSPVLVVLTYRDDEIDSNPVAREAVTELRREIGVRHLVLEGLDEEAVSALVRELRGVGSESQAKDLARFICEETGGNAFFVHELLAHLVDSGTSATFEEGSLETPSLLEWGIPNGVTEVIIRRSLRLSQAAKAALDVAAVAGRDFEIDVIERASGQEADPLLQAMDEAVAARLIQEIPGVIGSYRFAHGIIRDALYQTLGITRRARLHARVGRALEDLGRNGEHRLAELAHHFWMAGPAAESEKLIDYAIRAGDQALGKFTYERAATHFERALSSGLEHPAQEVRRCQVLMALATAQRKAGRVAEAREAFLTAANLARRLQNPEALACCALGLGGMGRSVSAWIGDDTRMSLLEEALEALGDDGGELRVRVSADLAKALHLTDQRQRRDSLVQEAVEAARRIDSPSALIGALSASQVVVAGPGNTELRLAFSDEMVDVAERAGDLELSVRARLESLEDLFEFGFREKADLQIDTVLTMAADLHQPYYLWRGVSWDALRAIVEGNFDYAERRAQDGLALWRTEPHPDAVKCWEMQQATLHILLGQPARGEKLVRSLADEHPTIPSCQCFLALLLAEQGRRSEAAAQFDLFASDGFVNPPFDSNWLFGLSALAETCAFLDDSSRAGILYELLLPFAGRMAIFDPFGGGGSFWGSVSHSLGLLAETMGRSDEAEFRFSKALEANELFRARPWAEKSRMALARCRAVVV